MEKRLKFARGVQPTREQALEIAQNVMTEPDTGWEMGRSVGADFKSLTEEGKHTYEMTHVCNNGAYHCRINLRDGLITVLKID